ncbi:MAG: O-antigen ligase family protein [Elusimicrobia bacterium]|nr:O-antigen ligase family protein [Elusimicrobiota bacterium]
MIAALPDFSQSREPAAGSAAWSPWPWVLAFSAAWGIAMAVIASVPPRFAIAVAAGLALAFGAVLSKDRRMYFLTIMTLALFLGNNKTLYKTDYLWPYDNTDRIVLSLVDVMLLVSYLLWFASSLREAGRTARPARTLLLPIAGLFLAAALSFVNAAHPVLGGYELIRMVKCLLLYWFLARNLRTAKELRWILGCLAFGLLFQLVVMLLQKYFAGGTLGSAMVYFGEVDKKLESTVGTETIFRAGGTLGHPNMMAFYLDMLLPVMLSLSFSLTSSPTARRYFTAATLAGFACLYFTMSRGGLVGTGVACALAMLFIVARNLKERRLLGRTALVAACGLLLAGLVAGPVYRRFTRDDAGALRVRFHQWRVAGNMIADHPLLGVGLNHFKNVAPSYDDTPVQISRKFRFPVHNVYLLAFSETGVVGLAALLAFLFAALRMANFRRRPYGEGWDLHLGFFFGILAYALHVNVDMEPPSSCVMFYFMLGLLTAAHNMEWKRPEEAVR